MHVSIYYYYILLYIIIYSGHGVCNGDGTREGNGTCTCFDNWSSSDCSECIPSIIIYNIYIFI